MRKIVDSNCINADIVKDYLVKSRKNFVVITDYNFIEAYKGNDETSIYQAMEVLSQYPKQVILLKNTVNVCGLKPHSSNIQKRMINQEGTKKFEKFCAALKQAKLGNPNSRKDIVKHRDAAQKQIDFLSQEATRVSTTINQISQIFTDRELKIIRRSEGYTEDIIKKSMMLIMLIAKEGYKDHPKVIKIPTREEFLNTYISRFAVCIFLYVVKCIANGKSGNLSPKVICNDMVDITFATYGTFFDGLITQDKNLNELYIEAKTLIKLLR